MNIETKLQDNYYTKKDSELYQKWIENGKIDPATGERTLAPTCYSEFRQDALEELELTDHPKAGLLMSLCWDKGHSSGYHEVWNYLVEWYVLLT